MALLSALSPVTGLVGSVASTVLPARKSAADSDTFKRVLDQQLRASGDPNVAKAQEAKSRADAETAAKKFMALHDSNNDQFLSRDESGMEAQVFQQLDLNRDGRLSLDEVRKPSMDQLAKAFPGAAV